MVQLFSEKYSADFQHTIVNLSHKVKVFFCVRNGQMSLLTLAYGILRSCLQKKPTLAQSLNCGLFL
jgi:hypothetical protein